MKTILRKASAVVMAAAMAAGLLSGCGAAYDPVQEVMGYSGDTVLFTVNGEDIKASDYFFWMAQNIDTVEQYYTSMQTEVDWTAAMGDDGQTMDEYVKSESQNMAVMYSVVAAKAEEGGYTFSADDKAEYAEQLESAKEQLGGEEAYQTYLKSLCLTEEGMEKLSSVGVLYSHMEEGMFREGGEYEPTREDLSQYAADNGYMYAKHILLMTKDAQTNEDLPDADKQAKKAKAEELAAQLQAITDPAELSETFDKLMNENSEDTGLQSNPDGYTFLSGQMVEPFENAVKSQQPGQVSGVVESDYGYHIILTLDPADSPSILSGWQGQKADELLNQWMEEAEIETTEAYDSLTTADFYEKLTAFRDTLEDPAEEEAADEAETGEPVDEGDVGAIEENPEGAEAAEETPAAEGEAVDETGADAAEGAEADATEGADAAEEAAE